MRDNLERELVTLEEEQNATTNEMARNLGEAARGNGETGDLVARFKS